METVQEKVKQINALIQEVMAMKKETPELKNGYYPSSYGSILNAYREGDLSFTQAVKALRKVSEWPK